MPGILADVNVTRHVWQVLIAISGPEWREVLSYIGFSAYSFRTLGLPPDMPDDVLWRLCQDKELVLVTANRNADGPNSLEAVIRAESREDSLPVFTIADADRVLEDSEYRDRVAYKMADYLFDIDRYRGSGRIYLP